jgi:histidinol-phosphate/aromatic aminotransferase/cobyric acid decarboxylase-like protein
MEMLLFLCMWVCFAIHEISCKLLPLPSCLQDGASPAVHYMMEMLMRTREDAFLVPIPQYPLYSATLTLYGGQLVPYELDEEAGWGLNVENLQVRCFA